MIRFLTDTADQAVILPVTAVTWMILLLARQHRAAWAWLAAVAGTLALVLLGKMLVSACGAWLPSGWDLHSPSGHTASAAVVYGGLAVLMLPIGPRRAPLYALIVAVLIGATRLALGVHTPADVVAGTVIGVLGATTLAFLGPKTTVPAPKTIFFTAGLVVVTLNGLHLDVESRIAYSAGKLWSCGLLSGQHGWPSRLASLDVIASLR